MNSKERKPLEISYLKDKYLPNKNVILKQLSMIGWLSSWNENRISINAYYAKDQISGSIFKFSG